MKNSILKTLALGAMIVGGVSIAMATVARIKRNKDEDDTVAAIVETEDIKEEFSGIFGR